MREGSYLLESLLIRQLEEQSFSSRGMDRRAFDLSGIASDVKSGVAQNIDTSSTRSTVETVARFLVPGVLFKISPILGVINTAAGLVGLDLVSLFDKFLSYISPKLSAGETIDPGAITQLGRAIGSSVAGDEDSNDARFASLLQDIVKKGYGSTTPDIPFFGGSSSSWLRRVFGNLFQMRAKSKIKWLIVGLITWLVKTTLLSAGLLAAGAAVKSLIHPSDAKSAPNPSSSPSIPSSPTVNPSGPVKPAEYIQKLEPSGRGEEQHVNDAVSSVWIVPVVQGSVESTLSAWIKDVYPDAEVSVDNPSFRKMVAEFQKINRQIDRQMQVPSQYKSRRQVVDKILEN